ncbi:permease [Vibrio sp. SCSIO 43136]|uniref:permease n=1 Tax=Vibrio sp. SCSIO 43136 TaxID=2819101 RepID=UPI0020752E22|nr:permease [Vibrio sp. SCSIO 43136]USD67500.1 permease [Vibrio sp. SCSIO 43136]
MLDFLTRFAETFWGMLWEMAPFLVIGVIAAGMVHEGLGRFQRLLYFAQKRSVLSLSFFNFLGLVLPICSCGMVPMAVGMRQKGVPYGNVFTFIFSAPATSITAIILAFALMGSEFTLWYLGGAVVCAYLIGILFYLIEPKNSEIFRQHIHYKNVGDELEVEVGQGNFFVRSFRWATTVYGSRIAFDLIVGLCLVAVVVSSFSLTTLSAWMEDMPFFWGCLLMIVLAIPMYVCSLPGIMLGATMILGGIKPEFVWIFLMAGPVTNLGDLNVLRKTMGSRIMLSYIAMVITLTIGWAYLIHTQVDWVDVWGYVRQAFASQPEAMVGPGSDSLWQANSVLPHWPPLYWSSTIAVILLVINGAWQTIKAFTANPCQHCTHYQADMALNPVVCKRPCWKKEVVNSYKSNRRRKGQR